MNNLQDIIRLQVLMFRVSLKEAKKATTEFTRTYQRGYAQGMAMALRDLTLLQKPIGGVLMSPALMEQYHGATLSAP